jgi:hypothetical protein
MVVEQAIVGIQPQFISWLDNLQCRLAETSDRRYT